MSSLVRRFAPYAVLTLAALSTAWFLTRPSSSPSLSSDPSGRAPASAASDSRGSSSLGLRYQPKEGHRYVYSFQRKITIQGVSQKDGSTSEIGYHGQFELDILKNSPQGFGDGFEALVRARVSEHPVKDPVALKIRLSATGEHLEIFGTPLHTEEERQQSSVLKDLLSLWVFHLHEDTVGAYDARFESNPYRKFKLSYVENRNQSSPLPQVLDSEHLLSWDEERALPREISGHEATRMGHAQAGTSYQIAFSEDQGLAAQAETAALKLTQSETLVLNAAGPAQELSESDWPELRSELLGLDSLDVNAQLSLMGKLVQLLKGHPGLSSDVLDLLRAQGAIQLGVQSALFKTALGGLISSGTAEGQATAIKVYSDPSCPVSGKGAILSAFTTSQPPLTPATQDFLSSTMKSEPNSDLAQGASYALGSSLKNATDEAQKTDTIEALRQRFLASSGNLADQLSALDAMGNSGQAAYLPDLRSIITSPDAAAVLKAKAVFALRFIHTGDATELLAQALSSSDFSIRQSAARAMAMAGWNEAFRAPLQSCASNDPVSSLQTTCRSVLVASSAQ